MKKLGLMLALAMAATACGGGKQKLTKEQKQEVAQTVNSAGRTAKLGQNSAERAGTRRALRSSSLETLMFGMMPSDMIERSSGLNALSDLVDPNDTPVNPDQSYELMEDAIEGKCEAVVDVPKQRSPMPGQMPSKLDVKFAFVGQQCPIDLKFNLAMTNKISGDSMKMNLAVNADYAVKDPAFRKYNDVDAFKLNLRMDGQGSEKKGGSMSMNLDGFINSQSQGKIGLSGKGSLKGKESATGSFTLALKYPDYTAEFELKVRVPERGEPSGELYLNGEKLSEEEIKELFGESAELGEDLPIPGNL